MRRNAENVKRSVQRKLDALSVGKPRPQATPGDSKVGADIDSIIRSYIKRIGWVSAIDWGRVIELDRPYRKIGKSAGTDAADVGPQSSAINRAENMAVSAEVVHHSVCYLGGGGIDLNVIDSGAARREVVLSPGPAVVGGNKDLAGGGKCAARRRIDGVEVVGSDPDGIYEIPQAIESVDA
jgi:hypothetical protein